MQFGSSHPTESQIREKQREACLACFCDAVQTPEQWERAVHLQRGFRLLGRKRSKTKDLNQLGSYLTQPKACSPWSFIRSQESALV